MSKLKAAEWIVKEHPEYDLDEVYDILLGNITKPSDMVREVISLSRDYEFLNMFHKEQNDKV